MAQTIVDQFGISDIADNLLYLHDGSICLVLESSSVNLDLKSEAESDVIITHYQQLLQSLTIPIQVIVKSRRVDMSVYEHAIQKRISESLGVAHKKQLEEYQDFLSQLVVGRNMLTRRFLIVLNLKSGRELNKQQVIEQLQTQKELLLRQLQKLEIKALQLSNLELANLFYESFQPDKVASQPLREVNA